MSNQEKAPVQDLFCRIEDAAMCLLKLSATPQEVEEKVRAIVTIETDYDYSEYMIKLIIRNTKEQLSVRNLVTKTEGKLKS